MIVVAMGKMGAQELNISSDIDLIFAYPRKGETQRQHLLPTENGFQSGIFYPPRTKADRRARS